MIISASYKTDIPAFYGEWFINRLRSGYCKMFNSYNRRISRVDLTRDTVDGFVFWTKNVGPFLKYLNEVKEKGYPFVVQYTINGYPRSLEFSVVDSARAVEHMKRLSDSYGSNVSVWRYDTIIFSSLTPIDFHRRNFELLAKSLSGVTNEVVISFAQIYRKTLRNMKWAADEFGFSWEDPDDEVKRNFASELAQVAKAFNINLAVCSQKQYLSFGVNDAHCIDASRLSAIAGCPIAAKQKGNRPDCGCYVSRDIGEYDTCPHGCVYCYAVDNRKIAQARYKQHDPTSEFLFYPEGYQHDPLDSTREPDYIQETLL